MKKTKVMPLALMAMMSLTLIGCGNSLAELNDSALSAEKLVDFKDGAKPDVLFESDGWSNGSVFNVVWKKHNVHYEDGHLRLGITEEPASAYLEDKEVAFDYTAGEVRTTNYYGYGDYEVSMKPSKNAGTASTFFTCTGPYDTKFVLDENGDYVLDENGQRTTVNNSHDEIDIEFLGKDTTKVQFNFFVNGVGGNEYMYDLGFDASEEFHEYGYRWTEDSITWFVDDKPVYKVTTDKTVKEAKNLKVVDALPSTPGRILSNYWCGTKEAEGWMGKFKGQTNDQGTEYKWMATSAIGAPLNPVESPVGGGEESETIDWESVNPIAPTFATTEEYTVTTDGNSANITYTDVAGSCYKNVEMDITQAASNNNYLYIRARNNGTSTSNIRVNVVDMELLNSGAQNSAKNISATMDGETVNTDLVWGGSFFDLEAGKTSEFVINYGAGVEKLQLMLDSSKNDAELRSGDITIEAIKFAKLGEVEGGSEGGEVTPTPNPGEGTALTFYPEANTGYTVTAGENNSVDVTYDGVGNTYKPITAEVASLAAGNNTFTITITNNGTTDSRVRVDVQGTTWVSTGDGSGTDSCNVSATGGDVWTDLTWGGSHVTVSAGQSVTLVITYDASGAQGAVRNILVFVDSSRGDANTYSSNVTLSGMSFYNA